MESSPETALKVEVESIMETINKLKGIIHDSSDLFKITRKDLYASSDLRNQIKFNKDKFIMSQKPVKSFERQHLDERSRVLA